MLLQNTTDIKSFKKYFDLFQETTEVSPILSQNAKDALQEKFKEVENILEAEITLQQIKRNGKGFPFQDNVLNKMISSLKSNKKPLFLFGTAETGKTAYAKKLQDVLFKDKTLYLRGSNYEIMQNKFAFMNVQEATELIIIDDIENEDVIFYAIELFNSYFPINKKGKMPYQQVIPNMILICGFPLSENSFERIVKKCSVFHFDKNRRDISKVEVVGITELLK